MTYICSAVIICNDYFLDLIPSNPASVRRLLTICEANFIYHSFFTFPASSEGLFWDAKIS